MVELGWRFDTRVAARGFWRLPRETRTVACWGVRNIVGRISMDMLCVELEESDSVSVGDTLELWGSLLRIEEVASRSNTIPYTLMCGVGNRVRRKYF